ncbi:MAG: prolyl oligopeptidase family serine peptidase [Candidatus Acidiferrales bacterium]|jgi:prolyl oligopeptidase
MSRVMATPPFSRSEPVTDFIHGVAVTDPYRWLEDGASAQTREWLEQQGQFTRTYLDGIPGRDRIRERIRELLAVETYDSLQKAGNRYFFRKRLPDQEQPCIYMREGADGHDQLLVDPSQRKTGKYSTAQPLRISPDGRLLFYEVKEGGERTGTFELLEIEGRKRLPDLLPRGYLRGFAFAPDSKSFYYVHEAVGAKRPFYRAAYRHFLGTTLRRDQEVFAAGEDQTIQLGLLSGGNRLAFVVHHFLEKTLTDIYLSPLGADVDPRLMMGGIDYFVGLRLLEDRILALTDRDAPNFRIVRIRPHDGQEHEWIETVPECDVPIQSWFVVGNRILVSYVRQAAHQIRVFDLAGKECGDVPIRSAETIRILGLPAKSDELFLEAESFTEPVSLFRYSPDSNERILWAKRHIPFDSSRYGYSRAWYLSNDGTRIPIYLVGRRDALDKGGNPTIMTSYGGYGISLTPQFSVFVAFLMEQGCLFALPNIRGGCEFGIPWHEAAKRRKRQTAYDDFLSAAEWLFRSGQTAPGKLAIFGGSNSGLLVGAALTQRPDLFRAVVCMVPILDMLRYHHFDRARFWKDEFGTAEDPDDFVALAKYSPYHQIRQGMAYPATMIVSGDADRNCNPLHARKMTARLQNATCSEQPIILDYCKFRGHSPVLPLSDRIEALTDRMAFICDQLKLTF